MASALGKRSSARFAIAVATTSESAGSKPGTISTSGLAGCSTFDRNSPASFASTGSTPERAWYIVAPTA